MPTAREQIFSGQIDRSTILGLQEDVERQPASQSVQGTVIGATAEGAIVRTSNGGVLTVENNAQGFTPSQGVSYQLKLSAGKAALVANSRQQTQTPEQVAQGSIRYFTRAPVNGQDYGNPGDIWGYLNGGTVGNFDQATFYVWSELTARFVPINGADEVGGEIQSLTSGGIYTIRGAPTYPTKILSLSCSVRSALTSTTIDDSDTLTTTGNNSLSLDGGNTVVQLSQNIGDTITSSNRFTITATAADSKVLEFTVGLLRA